MKRILALLVCIFCASLAWGQYSTAYQSGVTDITSYLPTTNAWKLIPGGAVCNANTLSIGAGYAMCRGGDGYFYSTSAGALTWTKQTAMGNQMVYPVVEDRQDVYALGGSGAIRKWDGVSTWNLISSPTTAIRLSAPSDGALVYADPSLNTFMSTDQGAHWSEISGGGGVYGPNLAFVAAASSMEMCGTGNNLSPSTVYLYFGSGPFTALSASGISPAGCAVYDDSTAPSVLVWNSSGTVKKYDIAHSTWSAVAGTMYGLTAAAKAETLGLDASGHPYHLNVYAGYTSGATTGSYTLCPNQPCSPSATHTITLQVKYPNGLAGAWGSITTAPTTNVNVGSFDFAADCDPFFGDPSDPQCHVTTAGEAHCNASGATLATPPPYVPKYNFSEDYVVYDDHKVISAATPYQNAWKSDYTCYVRGACQTGTAPACPAASIFGSAIMPSAPLAVSTAARQCLLGPWTTLAVYPPGTAPNGCIRMTVDHPVKVPGQCF